MITNIDAVKLALDDMILAKKFNSSDGKIKRKFKELKSQFEKMKKEKEMEIEKKIEKNSKAQEKKKEGTEEPEGPKKKSLMDYYGILYDEREESSYETDPRIRVPKKLEDIEGVFESKAKEVIQSFAKEGKKAN